DGSPEVLDHLAQTQYRGGDSAAAIETWRRLLRMVDDNSFADRTIQTYEQLQNRIWHIVVADSKKLYEHEVGAMLERVRRNLAAAEKGEYPELSPTWAEHPAPPPGHEE